MQGPINVKSPNIAGKWQMGFNSAFKGLNQIIIEYGLTISTQKIKSMALKGRDLVRTKILTDNKIME
jgi:hypothetical protein